MAEVMASRKMLADLLVLVGLGNICKSQLQ